jgi:hypothetical protein
MPSSQQEASSRRKQKAALLVEDFGFFMTACPPAGTAWLAGSHNTTLKYGTATWLFTVLYILSSFSCT